ncbi:2-methylaconitate cis-trans isomerase PrpF family protein [Rhodoligotrophos ferricapiens]|uniref:2-methylaconitate cis-trans isomerase PrpF family protein n=1 Tax=Rhodoligotrophos ferricapiens TaxID=3069264 RepID=UPI00315D1582
MSHYEPEQIGIRCTLMRGGTSKGVYLHEHDLPAPGPKRDALLLRMMGTPDVMQIDGLGGTHLVTSKIAIIGPSTRADADIDYTFAQAELDKPVIDYTGNCGNISAGVGPFAIDAGLVRPQEPVTEVRIHNTNTGKIMIAQVPVIRGRAKVKGDFAIAGVPGTGAEIFMDYRLTAGAKTGKVLPTGNRTDILELESGQKLEVTICDVANTIVFCRARDIGLRGDEGPEDINHNHGLVDRLREIRGKAAERIGYASSWTRVDEESPFLPFVVFVSEPSAYKTLNGQPVEAGDMDFKARLIFMNRCHESMAGTGSMCIAAASRVPDSIVNQQLTNGASEKETLSIGHPSGVMHVTVKTRKANNEEGMEIDALGFSRTARRIMDGTVYVPTSEAY